MAEQPLPEAQSLRGCIDAQKLCRAEVKADLRAHREEMCDVLESHRSEQRAVNAEMFRKLDTIRDRLPGDTAAAEAVSGPGLWRTVGLPVVLAVIIAVTSAAVMGGLGAYFAAPAKAAPGGP